MAKNIAIGSRSVEGINVSLNKLNPSHPINILDNADLIAIGSPSHNGNVSLDTLIFLANIKQGLIAGTLQIKGKMGFAFGSYSWDNGVCIDKLHDEMKNIGFRMEMKSLAQINPIPDNSNQIEFQKECIETGKIIAKKVVNIN